jgi:hypothetical protein
MKQGIYYAVADMLLLAQSNAIIVTPSSTFGYIAHGYGSLTPWKVVLGGAPAPIERGIDSEPSAHFWHPVMREMSSEPCFNTSDFTKLMKQEECCPRFS